jgi:hypothetical protein
MFFLNKIEFFNMKLMEYDFLYFELIFYREIFYKKKFINERDNTIEKR